MKKKLFGICILLMALPFIFYGKSKVPLKGPEGTVSIKILPVFNGKELRTGEQYVSENGDTVSIDVLRFYISHISLGTERGYYRDPVSYHLTDIENKESENIRCAHVPFGTYSFLNFYIGVDSAANVSGAMGGDLDPAKGMYWAWNSGYIMAKLEGRCNVCKTLHHAFEFHIGGYMPPYNVLRKVLLKAKSEPIVVKSGKATKVEIKADIAEWFKNPVLINLAKTDSIAEPGKEAMMMADNYADMFSISKIINSK
jgi:hypothetical protein